MVKKRFASYFWLSSVAFLSLSNPELTAGPGALLLCARGTDPCCSALAVRRRACPRRSRVSSATSAAASTCTTPRTARRRHRRWRSRRTQRTTAAAARSGPTATPARCSATGPPTATTTRPSEGRASPAPRTFAPPAAAWAECQDKGQRFSASPLPCPPAPESLQA